MTKLNPTPPVNSRYGAPMGRHTGPDWLDVESGKIHLQRVRLDSSGYDSGGAYWGHGTPLWYIMDQDGNSQFLRAASREAAKDIIRDKFEGARFFR